VVSSRADLRHHLAEADPRRGSAQAGGLTGPRAAFTGASRPVMAAVARILVAAVVPLAAQLTVPGDPAVPALTVGPCTWLAITARLDLAPRGWPVAGRRGTA
jgi:hypothetical protein